jgi:lipopolysaccharide transport system ATP-binding protein
MSNPVITVESLGKRYTLQHQAHSGLLRDQLAGFLRNPFRRAKAAHATAEEFWALRDVSFSVNQGEVIGIIGRNGAGKSTLLKILSRITEPTTGRVTLRGRVASLLEVGTGFHPELTGRENIFLNGAILGMARAEIRRKFDEIIAFAEVEKFLDTPVKYYSSGMYVRLAFAVAAHLEPEILIVDEVLAVGDIQFQQKCLGKMHQVSRSEGRTVLFVSHNMAAIQRLCGRCLYLRQGEILATGPTAAIIDRYLAEATNSDEHKWRYAQDSRWLKIEKVDILVGNQAHTIVPAGSTVTFRVHYCCTEPAQFSHGLECSFIVHGYGQKLANFWSNAGYGGPFPIAQRGVIICTVPAWPFRTMSMSLQVHLNYRLENVVDLPEAAIFESIDSDRFGTGIIPHSSEGIVLLPHHWEHTAE